MKSGKINAATVMRMAQLGWHLMPIRLRTKNPGTFLGNGWQDQASCDPGRIEAWIEQHGQCNWGVLLGASSGLIDVEDDDPEGRQILERAMAECGVVTPCYTSGKSIHRLFQYDERMAEFSASIVAVSGTEWRFGKEPAQSIVPPSIHDSGKVYEWLPGLSPDDVSVACLPESMWSLMLDLRKRDGERKAKEREAKRQQTKTQKTVVAVSMALMLGKHTQHVPAAEEAIGHFPWEKLLTDQGWNSYADDDWTRPGTEWTNARSATIFRDTDRLQVWTNAGPIDEGQYSKWRFWYQSHGFTDREQIAAAKAFLGPERSEQIQQAFRDARPAQDERNPPSPPYHQSPVESDDRDEALAVDALGSISPEDYDTWRTIGQALHSAGDHMLVHWIDWSHGSEKYNDGECETKWKTFNRGGGVGLGTLFHLALNSGWQRPKRNYVRPGKPTGIMVDTETGAKRIDEELPPNAVELLLDEMTVNDAVVLLLAERGDMFDHNGSLAVISDEHVDGEESRKTINHLSLATLREIISESCRFFTWEKTKAGEEYPAWQRTPKWCYDAVLARGHWTGIQPIRGIVTSPVLRADGSILQAEGYDVASGLYVDLTEVFPTINADPSTGDVQRAVAMLFDLVADFPFRDDASRSAWLASLLTPLAREAYRGCTGPLHLFDANVRGSGKSLLADINSLIVTGREATRLTAPRDDDEARKRITALVNDSDRIVLIDNISGRFGCASLDAALTGTVWKDRRLGHTELIEAPLRMVWYASGNNVILAADTARRVCHIRLESPLENPEDRSGFKYPDIRKHVRQHRPALLTAALTVLRGFIAAGRPDQRLKPWGSFEGWSDLVRAAIVWCGLADPAETRMELRATSDSEAGSLRQMLMAVVHVDQEAHGLRTSDMLKIATGKDQSYGSGDAELLREGIEVFCESNIDRVSNRKLGVRLSHFRNRVVDQMAFDCTLKGGTNYWFVQSRGGCGGSGVSHTANLSATEKTDVHTTRDEIALPSLGENRSTTSTTSTNPNPDIDWLDESHL